MTNNYLKVSLTNKQTNKTERRRGKKKRQRLIYIIPKSIIRVKYSKEERGVKY